MYEGEQDYTEQKLGFLYRFLDLCETMDVYNEMELRHSLSNTYRDFISEFPGW